MAFTTLIKPGYELRGFMIRLYPTKDDILDLHLLQDDTRTVWNWLVKQTEDTLDANKAYAVRAGLVPAAPVAPDYSQFSREQSKESKAVKKAYIAALKEWGAKAYTATKGLSGCEFRNLTGKPGSGTLLEHFGCKWDYQLLSRVIDWKYERIENEDGQKPERLVRPNSSILRALAKNHAKKSDRRKKFCKTYEPMPLQVRSGDCFEMGDFGARSNNEHFYNCQIKFNGLTIRGRLPGKFPEGRIMEGVSIVERPDGWWASIKQEVPIRIAPPPVPNTVVGIDVGLDNIAAVSEVRVISDPAAKTFVQQGSVWNNTSAYVISNVRDKKHSAKIAVLQQEEQRLRDNGEYAAANRKRNQAARTHLASSRHIKHIIHNEILKPLAAVETIKIEKLSSKIGFLVGSRKISVMRLTASMLTERYGEKWEKPEQPKNKPQDRGTKLQENRVKEVAAPHTSQDCSQCGERNEAAWAYNEGKVCKCPACNHESDRDSNASRNIAAKVVLAA